MAAAGAADREGEIALALGGIKRQQRFHEPNQAAEESGKMPIAPDIKRDPAVEAGERLQPGDIVRVAQEPDIEHQVRFAGQPMAVRERGHEHRHAGTAGAEVAGEHALEFARADLARVDDQIGAAAHGAQEPALAADAFEQRAFAGERMAVPRFGVAALENFIGRVHEDEARFFPGARGECVQGGEQGARIEIAGADVDADRERALRAAFRLGRNQVFEESEGHVVHRLEPQVLERLQGGAFSRPGNAGDEDDPARNRARKSAGARANPRALNHDASLSGWSWFALSFPALRRLGEREAKLDRRRRLERGEAETRKREAGENAAVGAPIGARHPFHPLRIHQIHHQSDFRGLAPGNRDDADPARLDQPGQRRRGRGDQAAAAERKLDPVVGDQKGAPVDQPEREIGLSRSRRAAQQDAEAVQGDHGPVDLAERGGRRRHERASVAGGRKDCQRLENQRRLHVRAQGYAERAGARRHAREVGEKLWPVEQQRGRLDLADVHDGIVTHVSFGRNRHPRESGGPCS